MGLTPGLTNPDDILEDLVPGDLHLDQVKLIARTPRFPRRPKTCPKALLGLSQNLSQTPKTCPKPLKNAANPTPPNV
jgi:hypothetical protein